MHLSAPSLNTALLLSLPCFTSYSKIFRSLLQAHFLAVDLNEVLEPSLFQDGENIDTFILLGEPWNEAGEGTWLTQIFFETAPEFGPNRSDGGEAAFSGNNYAGSCRILRPVAAAILLGRA